MATTVLSMALGLHVAAVWMSSRTAWTQKRLSWLALALATALLALWRFAAAYDAVAYDLPIDFGTEVLTAAIAALIIFGMRAATHTLSALRRSESRQRTVLESAMDVIVVVDEASNIVYANPAVRAMFGYSPRWLVGRPFSLLCPDQASLFERASPSGRRRAPGDRMTQLRGQHASGRTLELEVTFGEHEEDGRLLRTGIMRDVTARVELQEQLRLSEERFLLAARGANDGLWDFNLVTGEIFFSERWRSMLGLTERECSRPASWFGRIHPQDGERVREKLLRHLAGESEHFECEYRILHADRSYRWMLCRGLAVRDESGDACRVAGSQTEITARKHAEERLLHDALHDTLTGLPNRALLLERLNRCLTRSHKRGSSPCAVLFVDLDRFKNVNDSLGHGTGDRLLVEVARRLELCVRPTDTVARFGGDEFAILLEDLATQDQATAVADRVLAALSQSVHLDGHDVVTTASIGLVWGDADEYTRADELLRDVDAAMYRAKELGKARYEVFDAELQRHVRERLGFEVDLRRAIERDQIEVFYQPVVSLVSGRIAGFEALARWCRNGKMISPSQFIPVAEEIGLIGAIERTVLRRACATLAIWQKQFPLQLPLTMNVNLSGRHLREPGVVARLRDTLAETKPLPGTLRLEITESLLLGNDRATLALLEELKALGIKLVIDDFGTGYSSLSYLHRLPIDVVKLDRSFVHEMEASPERAAIVSTVVTLAKQLSLSVVAEGVETIAELDRLRRFGCDMAQGYFFSRPIEAAEAAALVTREIEVFDGPTYPNAHQPKRLPPRRVA